MTRDYSPNMLFPPTFSEESSFGLCDGQGGGGGIQLGGGVGGRDGGVNVHFRELSGNVNNILFEEQYNGYA